MIHSLVELVAIVKLKVRSYKKKCEQTKIKRAATHILQPQATVAKSKSRHRRRILKKCIMLFLCSYFVDTSRFYLVV